MVDTLYFQLHTFIFSYIINLILGIPKFESKRSVRLKAKKVLKQKIPILIAILLVLVFCIIYSFM